MIETTSQLIKIFLNSQNCTTLLLIFVLRNFKGEPFNININFTVNLANLHGGQYKIEYQIPLMTTRS